MNVNRVTALAAVCVVAAGGTGAAVAASGNSGSGNGSKKFANCAKYGKGKGRFGGPFKSIADALGIKVSSLQKQLKAGKKLSEIATAQGKTLDDVKTAYKAALKTRLDKAVAAGRITQAQADDQLAKSDTLIDDIEAGKKPAGRPGFGGGPGGPGGYGHGGPGGGGPGYGYGPPGA